jgi:type IV pilus assembly protein PilM
MKHRQTGITKVGLINADGHAIGLDIGATAVRAAILAPGTHDGRPSVTVHGLGHVELPEGAVVSGVVVDKVAVTNALKHLWQINKFECRNVILGITNQQIVVRDMTVPNLSPDQRAKALPFQAKEIVALPMDQVLLDFAALGDPDPETGMIAGLLVATPRLPVLSAVEAVERAGLKVARVDLSSFAALRSIADERLSVEAVIDLGAHMTNVVIHNQGIPKVVRTVSRGGKELTERLADKIGLSLQEAEIAKYEVGLTGSHAEVARVLNESIRPLLAEIRSSIHYFSSTNGGALLERISLTGGASGLLGLGEALSEQIGVPTNVVTPMQHIRNRWASKQAQLEESEGWASAVSVGLAMGAAA